MFGDQPEGFMFQAVPIFVGIIFVIVIIGILVAIIKSISQWNKNNKAPNVNVKAKVVAKRTEIHGGGETRAYNDYFVTFEVESGERMELEVKDTDYGMLVKGDQGLLQYQGSRFLGFKRIA